MGTIGRAVLELSIDGKGFNKGLTDATGQMKGFGASIGRIGKMMAGAFTVGALANMGKKVLDLAGNLTDLQQRTGVSTTALQKWGLAFEQSGVSLDTVVKASGELATRLVSGDKGAVGALNKLGLSVAALKNMSPEDQFNTVADAVGNIQHKGEQLYASKTLFGKSGLELLQGLDGKLLETIGSFERMGVILSEDVIKNADNFGDSMVVLERVGMALVANVIAPALPGLVQLAQWLGTAATGAISFAKGIEDWLIKAFMGAALRWNELMLAFAEGSQKIPLLGKYLGASDETVKSLRANVQFASDRLNMFSTMVDTSATSTAKARKPMLDLGDSTDDLGKTAKKTADELEKFKKALADSVDDILASEEAIGKLTDKLMEQEDALDRSNFVDRMREENDLIEERIDRIQEWVNSQKGLNDLMNAKASAGGGVMSLFQAPNFLGVENQRVSEESRPGVFAGLGDMLKNDLGPAILSAFQGGGDVSKTVGGLVGGKIGTNIVTRFGETLTSKLGPTIGGAFGSVIPGLGTLLGGMAGQLLGPLIGKVGQFFKEMFGGPSVQELEGREAAGRFRQGLLSGLSATQMLEVRQALKGAWEGNELGAATVIAVRDAYMKAGKSAEEALAIVDRLWRAEKEGGDAVKDVLAEIAVVMEQGATPAMKDFGEVAEDSFEKARLGAIALANEMRRTYGANNDSESGGGSIDFDPKMFDPETGSWVSPTFERWRAAGNQNSNEGDFRRAFNMDIIDALRSGGISEAAANAFAQANGGDIRRMGKAFNLPGFATGGIAFQPTAGIFGEKGPEALVPLDRYDQATQGRDDLKAQFNAMKEEFASLRRDLRSGFQDMPRRMAHAVLTAR